MKSCCSLSSFLFSLFSLFFFHFSFPYATSGVLSRSGTPDKIGSCHRCVIRAPDDSGGCYHCVTSLASSYDTSAPSPLKTIRRFAAYGECAASTNKYLRISWSGIIVNIFFYLFACHNKSSTCWEIINIHPTTNICGVI